MKPTPETMDDWLSEIHKQCVSTKDTHADLDILVMDEAFRFFLGANEEVDVSMFKDSEEFVDTLTRSKALMYGSEEAKKRDKLIELFEKDFTKAWNYPSGKTTSAYPKLSNYEIEVDAQYCNEVFIYDYDYHQGMSKYRFKDGELFEAIYKFYTKKQEQLNLFDFAA